MEINPNLIWTLIGYVFTSFCLWKIFIRAGRTGWLALIPMLNVIILIRIAEVPAVYFLLLFIPLINVIFWIYVTFKLAARFEKGTIFALGMLFLPFITYPILALEE